MQRTIRVKTELCKQCHAEMCDAHLAAEVGVTSRCSISGMQRLCASCGERRRNADAMKFAGALILHSRVVGIAVDEAQIKEVIIERKKWRYSIHAMRGGALVVSVETKHGRRRTTQ
jgi:hypothetical protein